LPRLRALTAVLAFAAVAVTGAGASARPAPGSGHPASLSRTERGAVTLESLGAVGDGSLGLVLTATFRGDVERYLGQGGLEHGALALELAGASGTPAGVLDTGGGDRQVRLPAVDGHGTGATTIVTPDTVLPTAQARGVTVLRDGAQVIFYVPASELSHVAEIKLEVFATSPIGSGPLTPRAWREVLAARPAGHASVAPPPNLTCARLDAILDSRTDVSPPDLEPELVQEEHEQAALEADLGSLRGATRAALEHDLGDVAARIARLKREVAGVGGVATGLANLLRTCVSQATTTPPATTPTTPTPPPATPPPAPAVGVTQTDAAADQDMAPQPDLAFTTTAPSGVPVIDVNDQVRYQQFEGLGAAMTDSSAWLIYDNLSAASRLTLMQDLFSTDGIHLNFLRVPMGASDFTVSPIDSPDPYTYDDVPAGESDPDLTQFSIAHDLPYIIPTIQQALQINPDLIISANPWSPPAWMKANDSLDNVDLGGTLLTTAYQPLADYFVKFIEAYEDEGIPIDIIVPQNEPRSPGGSGTSYPGLTLPEADEATFISGDLEPALSAAGLDPKIYGNDLSWDKLSYAEPLASSSAAADLSGMAWHCYAGSPTVMSQLQEADPGLDQIVDECSPEIRSFGAPEYLISALRNWASVASVWNVALDPEGGPKQTDNGCPGCIGLATINEQTQAFTFNTEYYELGQVSAFVEPGAVRVDSPNFVTYGTNSSNIETVSSGLDDVAFLNPDGSQVLITYNNSTAPITFAAESNGSYFSYTLPAGAMTTFTWS